MCVSTRSFFAVCVLGLCASSGRGGDNANPYLAAKGRLKQTLQMLKTEPGQDGRQGTVWTIEPSGEWRVVPFVKDRPGDKILRKGKLTPNQLLALANHLAAQDFLRLPKDFGVGLPVNPHLITIRFGKKSTTFDCGNFADPTEAAPSPKDPQAAAWSRVVALAFVIEHMTERAKAPAPDKRAE
jgi:hypothetical protein